MEVRFCITTTPRSRSGLLNPPAASSQIPARASGLGAGHEAVEMTKEENPQNQKMGILLCFGKRKPALPTFPPHDYYCCTPSPPNQSNKTTMAPLATFLTYPQIPQSRL